MLTIPGFLFSTSFLYLVLTLAFKKSIDQRIGLEIRPQIAVVQRRPPFLLQAVLLDDLAGCGKPLSQIVMATWSVFLI